MHFNSFLSFFFIFFFRTVNAEAYFRNTCYQSLFVFAILFWYPPSLFGYLHVAFNPCAVILSVAHFKTYDVKSKPTTFLSRGQ